MTKEMMILKHLKKFKKITPLEALKNYGSMRLGAVIFKLRKDYNIITNIIDVNTRFGTSRVAQYCYRGKK